MQVIHWLGEYRWDENDKLLSDYSRSLEKGIRVGRLGRRWKERNRKFLIDVGGWIGNWFDNNRDGWCNKIEFLYFFICINIYFLFLFLVFQVSVLLIDLLKWCFDLRSVWTTFAKCKWRVLYFLSPNVWNYIYERYILYYMSIMIY